jgi:hypothetical protein
MVPATDFPQDRLCDFDFSVRRRKMCYHRQLCGSMLTQQNAAPPKTLMEKIGRRAAGAGGLHRGLLSLMVAPYHCSL